MHASALLREDAGGDPARAGRIGEALRGGRVRLEGLEPRAEYERAVADSPAALRKRLRALITREAHGPAAAVLTPADLETLERIGVAASAALLLDLRAGTGIRSRSEEPLPASPRRKDDQDLAHIRTMRVPSVVQSLRRWYPGTSSLSANRGTAGSAASSSPA